MRRRPVQLWVHPDFRQKMKMKSAEENISIFEYTKQLSKEQKDLRKRRGFKLEF